MGHGSRVTGDQEQDASLALSAGVTKNKAQVIPAKAGIQASYVYTIISSLVIRALG
jgi:hypothetical protein